MVQFELLILPCIASITVVLAWITFLLKDSETMISKNTAKGAFIVAWISIASFILSLTIIIYILINLFEPYTKYWAYFFVLGWILFVFSIFIFSYKYLSKKLGLKVLRSMKNIEF